MQRLYGSRWHGVAIGLLSTFAGLAVAELIVGLVRGAASPVLPVGQEVIDVVPPEVKDWAIDWFGTADKAVLILGTLLSLAVIGSIVGNLAVKGNRAAAYAVTAVVGVIGVWAVTMRPAPSFGKVLPPIVGTLVSIAVIWWLSPRDTVTPAVPGAPDAAGLDSAGLDSAGPGTAPEAADVPLSPLSPVAPVGRRSFLQGAGTVGVLSLAVGGMGRVLKRRFEVGDERAALELPDVSDPVEPVTSAPATAIGDGAGEAATTDQLAHHAVGGGRAADVPEADEEDPDHGAGP